MNKTDQINFRVNQYEHFTFRIAALADTRNLTSWILRALRAYAKETILKNMDMHTAYRIKSKYGLSAFRHAVKTLEIEDQIPKEFLND